MEIEIRCIKCNNELYAIPQATDLTCVDRDEADTVADDLVLKVQPCSDCLGDEYGKGFTDGKKMKKIKDE